MKSSINLAERRYYTSASWASRENPQIRVKAQGHSSSARAKKAHQASTHFTAKFTDGCGPLENWEKNFRPPRTESKNRHMILEKTEAKLEVATQIEVMVGVKRKTGPSTTCSTKETLTIRQETPIFLESKKRMTQRHSQPSTACIAKDVNHTSH
jgi:hypothetical protein